MLSELDTLCAASFKRDMTPRAERRMGMATRDDSLPPLDAAPEASPEVDDTVRGVCPSDADAALSVLVAILMFGLTTTGMGANTVADNL